jgi:integrase
MIRGVFRWAAEEELIKPETYAALRAVRKLKRGHTAAVEREPVMPAPIGDVNATLPYLTRPVRGLVRLQLLTGARPGEVARMKLGSIDMSKNPWEYRPEKHKTQYKGHERVVFLSTEAQEVVREYFTLDTTAYLFRPTEGASERYNRAFKPARIRMEAGSVFKTWTGLSKALHRNAHTLRWWAHEDVGNGWPIGKNPPWTMADVRKAADWIRRTKNQTNYRRKYSPHYSTSAYLFAVRRGIARANEVRARLAKASATELKEALNGPDALAAAEEVSRRETGGKVRTVGHWHPHQLRHNAATWMVEKWGWEVARVLLGHHSIKVTRIYAEDDLTKAREAIKSAG